MGTPDQDPFPRQVGAAMRPPPFAADALAVSAVIGVILMVATTVVMATVVFFVMQTGQESGLTRPGPTAVDTNEAEDRLVVIKADPHSDWDNVRLRASAPLRFAINGPAGALSTPLPADTEVQASLSPLELSAGDSLSFCGDGGDQEFVRMDLSTIAPEELVDDWTFSLVRACA